MRAQSPTPLKPAVYRLASATLASRRHSRGTATVEAVVVLPFFIMILAGIGFVRDKQLAIQAAENRARSCAWQYSANDCSQKPAGCEDVLKDGIAPRSGTKVDDVLNSAKSQVLAGGDAKGVIEKVATDILGPAIDALFGRYLAASTHGKVNRPGILGGGQTVVEGQYHLACNLRSTNPGDVVSDAWDKIVK